MFLFRRSSSLQHSSSAFPVRPSFWAMTGLLLVLILLIGIFVANHRTRDNGFPAAQTFAAPPMAATKASPAQPVSSAVDSSPIPTPVPAVVLAPAIEQIPVSVMPKEPLSIQVQPEKIAHSSLFSNEAPPQASARSADEEIQEAIRSAPKEPVNCTVACPVCKEKNTFAGSTPPADFICSTCNHYCWDKKRLAAPRLITVNAVCKRCGHRNFFHCDKAPEQFACKGCGSVMRKQPPAVPVSRVDADAGHLVR